MPVGRDQLRVTVADQPMGREHHISVAAVEQLKRLADVFAVNDLRLDFLPKALMLKGLPGGGAIRRKLGVRKSDKTNPIGS